MKLNIPQLTLAKLVDDKMSQVQSSLYFALPCVSQRVDNWIEKFHTNNQEMLTILRTGKVPFTHVSGLATNSTTAINDLK